MKTRAAVAWKANAPLTIETVDLAGPKAGVMDQVTLREFERMCLPPVEPLEPAQIKQIRDASPVGRQSSRDC